MNTCKTCKWWAKWDQDWVDKTGSVVVHCENEHNHAPKDGSNVKDRSAAVDGEEDSGIFTGPDFGCIHYEETQEQLPQEHPGYAMQQEAKKRVQDFIDAQSGLLPGEVFTYLST